LGLHRLNIWITGCSGFLGNRLVRHFRAAGHRVIGLSRRGCPDAELSVPIDLAADVAVTRLQQLISEVGQTDVLIHAASKQPGSGSLSDFVRGNVQTTANLLEAFGPQPPRQIIYTSTLSVYNQGATPPVNETAPAEGTLPYGATKRWAEKLLDTCRHSSVTVLRLPSLYGAGQADSFIDGLARVVQRGEPIELFSRGELIRDALHVSDVLKAIAACVDQPLENAHYVLNLGCGRPITTLEYAQTLVAALESKSEIRCVDRPATQLSLYADIEQARRRLGFEPTPLAQSIKAYVDELRT
jgi:nucleoside-diphosphate-sugar epimerase